MTKYIEFTLPEEMDEEVANIGHLEFNMRATPLRSSSQTTSWIGGPVYRKLLFLYEKGASRQEILSFIVSAIPDSKRQVIALSIIWKREGYQKYEEKKKKIAEIHQEIEKLYKQGLTAKQILAKIKKKYPAFTQRYSEKYIHMIAIKKGFTRRSHRVYDEEKKQQVIELRQQGRKIKEIAKITGISETTIYRILRKAREEGKVSFSSSANGGRDELPSSGGKPVQRDRQRRW